ncbi:MAG: 23S rRNA (guanosine(2251)-2'-O)-methyltransferase RlmB [Candidatus Enteromonas sp.]
MDSIAYGINAVREYARSHRVIKVYCGERLLSHSLLFEMKKENIPFEIVNDARLRQLSKTDHHQGIVAEVKPLTYTSLHSILDKVKGKPRPLLLILDGIKDPHNFGAILRSCDAFSVDGVIIKKNNAVPLNETVARVSTGAINYVDVALVPNLSSAIQDIKKAGFWVVSTDGSAKDTLGSIAYDFPTCLIVGSEGEGISRLVLANSDYLVKIPMTGHVNSLNASVSCGISLALIREIQNKNI